MCWFFIVIKLLMLKILLAGLTGLITASRYDYGYHPSAEELDNLLRETPHTWTHSHLKDERERLSMRPTHSAYQTVEDRAKTEARHFVPKFQYENNESKKLNHFIQNPLLTKHHQDLQTASSQKQPMPLQNIGSSLEFNYFSDELPKPFFNTAQKNPETFMGQPTVPTTTIKSITSIKPVTSALPEINLKPIAKPNIWNSNKYSLNNIYKNNSQGHFPVYFTNPATGIVYAITEMGKSTKNLTRTNGSIPIFITKEQYEKDIFQLKNEYEQKCQILQSPFTSQKPQIIRLKRPLSPALPITSSKFSPSSAIWTTLKQPLPVVVKTELTVTNKNPVSSTTRPLRKKKKKPKLKHKIKKQNPPGHKILSTSTVKPIIANHPIGPAIVVGSRVTTRKPTVNNEKLPTQLEKPDFSNIFSSALGFKAHTLNPNLFPNNHRLNKRSPSKNSAGELESVGKNYFQNFSTIPPVKSLNDFKQNVNKPNENKLQSTFTNQQTENLHHVNKRSIATLTKPNSTEPKFIKKSIANSHPDFNKTELKNTTNNILQTNKQSSDQHRNLKSKITDSINSTENASDRKSINTTLNIARKNKKHSKSLKKQKRLSKIKLKNKHLQANRNSTINKIDSSHNLTTTPRTIKKGNSNQGNNNKIIEKKSDRQRDTDYYFFATEDNYDDEEDEDYENDDDDEEEDEEEEQNEKDENDYEEVLDYDEQLPHTSEVNLSIEDLSEKPTQETNSSPEADDNMSALKKEPVDIKSPPLDYDNDGKIGFKTKSTYNKKRIRRRPPQLKIDVDYDEDGEDEDNSLSSNLGGFFRMIFYPIQVVMSSVMDSFNAKDTEEEDDGNFNPYVQYTSYHNTLKQHSSAENDDDYDSSESGGSLLSNWFSSWFGLNRRNKKIGSTTEAPNSAKPTKSSNSWLPSWLSFGANERISTESSSNEEYDEYDKWFASWFGDTKPKARKRTTTSTTTQIPHVPILTIVDPMKNPQNWIGILAHHIINHTSSSTANPLKDMWNRVTTTTTENPEIPRKILYDKYQIWRLKPQDDSKVKALEEYKKSEDGIKLQWLKGPSLRGLTDVLVPPKMLVDFQASLTFELIDHEVLIFDVGKAIAYEKTKEDYFFTTTQKPKKHHSKIPAVMTGMTWYKYHEYDDIIKFLETMRMRFPHLVELIHIGRSYEGRPLIVMKIESKEAAAVNSANYPAHQRNKLRHKKRIGLANAVFIEAGTHGMEWIGPATATWIINELLRIMKKNVTDDQSFIRNTTWYIMPVLNPDGYIYSHEYDRFWKKSRSRHISRPSGILSSAMTWLQKKRAKDKICFGVDLDRNWHYQWGRRGSSKSACNEFYAGPTPFSEPETKALSEFLMDYRTQIKLFVSMQAYGQVISYPYKANTTYDSERLDDLLDVAMVGTDGLRKKGSKSRYKIDSSNDLIENRSGCSDAYAAYEAGIPFSYTLQLADNGVHGYLLPSASIESTAKDSFEIIKEMLDYI